MALIFQKVLERLDKRLLGEFQGMGGKLGQ